MGVLSFSSFVLAFLFVCLCFTFVPFTYVVFAQFVTFIGAIKLSEWLMDYLRWNIFYKRISPGNKAVFITGCDSGFGHMLATRLDKLGYRVFAACLAPTGEGAITLKNACSSRLTVLPLDVTIDESVQSAKEFVWKHLQNDVLWAVVNNAGIPLGGEVEWTAIEDFQRVFDINTLGTVRVSKAFLPLLRKSRGRLVNITSSVGRFICPAYVGYCMSKSAAIAFTTGLRVEMMKWGVKVISIEPFFYKTALTQEDNALDGLEKAWSKADPQIREDYGEAYITHFKKLSKPFLRWVCSPKTYEVIECFEHAITAVEPLKTYFPAYLPHKITIKIFQVLPSIVVESYQKLMLDGFKNPIALMKSKKSKSR